MTPPFVHLHCHSHYSLLDGASPIKELVDRAKELGMNGLALTDHGNLYGALQFYQACRDAQINPVLGYEAYIAPGSRFERGGTSKESSYHLTLLAKNSTGFRNLVKLASRAFLEGFYHKPRIDRELLTEHNEGILCLSGCVSGEFSRALLTGSGAATEDQIAKAMEVAAWFHRLFGERYFIEVQNNGLEIQQAAMEAAVEVANRMGLPLVATSDAHYVRQEDAEAQDVLLCINTGKYRTDTNRMKMEGNQFFLRSPAEMHAAFPAHEEALARSQEIANSVDIDLELGRRHFPTFTPPERKSSESYLRELCIAGLEERYAGLPQRWQGGDPASGQLTDEVFARLDRELGVINKLGFCDYFLIVWDFVRFAVEQNIPCTARGSGVGSLVCFALKMSHVCPLRYDLLFERFLDESRLEAPDIDIDFCKQRRAEVIQYVKDKYGEANVAQIGTFGTLAARAAIRDVGRTMGLPIFRVDQIVAMVPDQLGISIDRALKISEELAAVYETDGDVRELLDLARKIEGLARNVGTHAAAVVIAENPVDHYVPLQQVKGKTEVITQWAMGDVERAGLLKIDFLGLRNLTILARSIELVEEARGERIDPYQFPLDDADTFALLCRGETKGIFQLESGGIRDLLQRMKPDNFLDVIATNALYRPGPLEGGMVDDYIEVKHGRQQAQYPHPVMEDILRETHGVMVYQEQVMRILNRLGGIQLSNAYTCIKAISKKKRPMIAKYREQFIEGAHAQGLAKKSAAELFGMIEKFAGYGFNKCVVGETQLLDAQTGRRTTVEELFRHRQPYTIHALGKNGRLEHRSVTDVVWNGRKRTYRLSTAQGKTLTATANHPIRTLDGWTHLGHLQVGDRIAAPRHLATAGDQQWAPHEVIALAGLLSEGNTCHPSCLYFYNNDQALIDDFVDAISKFPDTAARVDIRRGNRIEVCVSTGRDCRFQPLTRQDDSDPLTHGGMSARAAATLPACSGAYEWARGLDLIGKRASEKFVPEGIFRLSADQIALFLGRLWSGDGYVGAPGQMPYYATSSRQLAEDVQALLLRLGVVSGVHEKTMKYRYQGQKRQQRGFTVHLVGDDSMERYLDHVLPQVVGREEQMVAYRHSLGAHAPLTSKDTIPADVRRLVDEQRKLAGLTWRQLEAQSGISVRELAGKGSPHKKGFRRSTIARLGAFFESSELLEVASSDIFWDQVVAIEPTGIQDTYDLTVAEDHNFVANGLIVHNSHSTAYALIAYMTAYLKAHYPVEFMAALLSCDIPGRNFKSKDALVEHIEDCRRMKIDVLPPDVNASAVDFIVRGMVNERGPTPAQPGHIHFGLSAIKGCGGGAAEAIVAAHKKGGPFKSLYDLCERVDSQSCNRSTLEALIKAGAMDHLGGHRAQLLAVLDRALQAGAAAAADRRSGQKGLFDMEEEDSQTVEASLPEVTPWMEKDGLGFEREVLGFYLSSHPLAEHESLLRSFCTHFSQDLGKLPHRSEVMLGGMISAIKFSHTKNPRPGGTQTKYAMWDLEDLDGIVRCILWPEQFAEYGQLAQADAILAMRGKVDRRPGKEEVNLIVDELIPLAQLPERFAGGILIRIQEQTHGERGLEQLREILRGYPGKKRLKLRLDLASGGQVWLDSGWPGVQLHPELRQRVDGLLGPGNLRLQSAPPPTHQARQAQGGRDQAGGRR